MGEPNKQDKKEIRRKQKKNIFYKRKNYKKAPFLMSMHNYIGH